MNKKVDKEKFNQNFIKPVSNLYGELDSFNKYHFIVIPQPLSRCHFFSSNNIYSVFTTLLSWFDENGKCDVSRSVLAKHSRINKNTVDKAIVELVSKGFICKKNNIKGNEKDFNTFILNDLTINPYLILSEAIYTIESEIKNTKTDVVANKLIKPLNKENATSILIKRIENEAKKDIYKAYKIACKQVEEHFEKELGIVIEYTPIIKKKPAKIAGKSGTKNVTPKHNREWKDVIVPANTPKAKIRF